MLLKVSLNGPAKTDGCSSKRRHTIENDQDLSGLENSSFFSNLKCQRRNFRLVCRCNVVQRYELR